MNSMSQINIFELTKQHFKFKLNKKIQLFEAFSGIGCQLMAFKRLGLEVESVGFSEIDKYALQSYKAIHGDLKNWGSICDIKGQDLPQIDVFTYSFPCTDLSKAGKQKGLNQTRSGLVYEVLRILQELHQVERLPKVLIMENVVDLIQVKFIREFQGIQLELENIGYTNYTQTLNAKDYGVAQNRDRVFMVSILGDYYYEFPQPIKLEKRLKDYLETEVDEKYYLSENLITRIKNWNSQQNPIENAKTKGDSYIQCITAKSNTTDNASMLLLIEPIICASRGRNNRQELEIKNDGSSNALTTVQKDNYVLIPEATEKGYAKAFEGDCINMSQPKSKTRRGRVGNQIAQTLTTQNEIGVVIYDDYNSSIREDQNTIGTLTTKCGSNVPRNGYKLIEPKIIEYNIEHKVTVRKYDVDVDELKELLSTSKNNLGITNNQLSNKLNLPITLIEHWFRKDESFSIPPKDVWFRLKEELKIKTNKFDDSITEFIEKDGVYEKSNRVYHEHGISPTITCVSENEKVTNGLRIRKLTPLECWRLMGIDDYYFEKASKVNSNAQLYKQAGNGIVVDVFTAIIKELIYW